MHKIERDKCLALVAAAAEGDIAGIVAQLENGADIHYHDDTALCGALYLGHREVVELLLERGANVHADGETPLFAAITAKDWDMIELLLKKGADPQAVLDNKGHLLDADSLNIIDSIQSRGAKAAAEKSLETLREKAKKSGPLLRPKSS